MGSSSSPRKAWRKLGADDPVDHGIFALRRERFESPRTGEVLNATVVEPPDWVNILAFTPADECLLIRQFRFGTQNYAIEIPGGVIDPGESPREAAERELREETGYIAQRWTALGRVAPNPAMQRNYLYTFLAEGCTLAGDQVQDPGEDIEVMLTPRRALDALIAADEIDHALVVVAFHKLELLRRAQHP